MLATDIFNRVDWGWLSEDTSLLPHGWRPESGFLQYRWDNYSEMMMMYLLGLGSELASAARRRAGTPGSGRTFEYDGIRYIGSFAPLFVHQYSQAWFDFRGKRDKYTDYFRNSVVATDVHRRFCIDLAGKFPDYSDDLWGITASDSVRGYVVWGGPPHTGPIDGTVVPCACGRFAAISAGSGDARAAHDEGSLRQRRLVPVRLRRRVQSAHQLVRSRCDRHRYRDHHGHGGKRAHRICVGHLHEESGSQRGMVRAGFRPSNPKST